MKAAAGDASEDSGDTVGGSLVVNGCTYTILALADGSATGTVQLSGVDRTARTLVIPSSVSSPASDLPYTVTKANFAAFNNDTALVSVTLPASISSVIPGASNAFFYGCSSLEAVSVSGSAASSAISSDNGVLYLDNGGKKATLAAYPRQKAGAEFTVPASVSTISPFAFAENEHLASVAFKGSLAGEADKSTSVLFCGGIGTSAFQGCIALQSVSFPENAEISTVSTSARAAIGASAFKGCTSLKKLAIPAIVSADQKANAYESFSELNPRSNLASGADESFTSGYASYWHNGNGPVARPGIGSQAFGGCTALESVAFAAGNSTGAFAYWVRGDNVFSGCTALKSLVYESTQAYWGNPDASMQNSTFADIWSEDYNGIDAPDYYYAVDYYATESEAKAADASGSTRLCRVEYRRGTSTSDIATSAEALAGQTADRALYAQKASDGVIPNPDEAAAAAGLSGTGWAWKLDGTQSRRAGLSESCRAYLVKADDLGAGRLDSSQMQALYLQADRNLSQGTALCPGSAFDVERYAGDDAYSLEPFAGETSPYFTYNPTTGELDGGFSVVAADGTVLDASTYEVGYQRYDAGSKSLEDVSKVTSGGAYLVTITPAGDTCTGSLSEWVVVQARTGNLVEAYGSTPATTETAAKHPYSQTSALDYSSAPYSVTVGASDVCGALVASSCAGLVGGAIDVDTGQTGKKFGFWLNRSTHPDGSVDDSSQTLKFTRSTDAPAFAVAVYERFKSDDNRRTYGIAGDDDYSWGDTALLVPLGHVDDIASACAYAYAMKAPVFFTNLDGSCSNATRAALGDFAHVKVTGSAKLYPAAAFSRLQDQLGSGTELSRLAAGADNRGEFSLAVADELVAAGQAAYTTASVSDAADPMDCILSLDFTGHEGGVTLVSGSTAQSKKVMDRLHEHIDGLSLVMLFGRTEENATVVSSKAYGSKNAIGAIWESDEDFESALDGVATTVKNANFTSKTTDPDHEKAKRVKKAKKHSASGKTPSRTKGHAGTAAATVTKWNTGSGSSATSGTVHASGTRTASVDPDGDAGAGNAATATQADAPADEASEADLASTDTTPLWTKVLFIAVLVACCAALIPVLRKCR